MSILDAEGRSERLRAHSVYRAPMTSPATISVTPLRRLALLLAILPR
jgi:hypothetical protein